MNLKIYPADMRPIDKDVRMRLWHISRGQPKTEGELEDTSCDTESPDVIRALAELAVVNDRREKILSRYPELAYFERLTIIKIAEVVSKYYGLRTKEVISHRRISKLVHARFVIYFFCRELLSKSYPEIARRCAGRDHSTVIHGIQRLEEMLKTNETLVSDLDKIREILLKVRKTETTSG